MMEDATAAKAARGLDTTVTRVTGTEFSVLLTRVVAVSGLKYAGGAAGVSTFGGDVLGSVVTRGAGARRSGARTASDATLAKDLRCSLASLNFESAQRDDLSRYQQGVRVFARWQAASYVVPVSTRDADPCVGGRFPQERVARRWAMGEQRQRSRRYPTLARSRRAFPPMEVGRAPCAPRNTVQVYRSAKRRTRPRRPFGMPQRLAPPPLPSSPPATIVPPPKVSRAEPASPPEARNPPPRETPLSKPPASPPEAQPTPAPAHPPAASNTPVIPKIINRPDPTPRYHGLLTSCRAAAEIGLDLATFRAWVAEGRLPQALPDCAKYDMKAIHLMLDRMSGIVSREIG
jgi:hypothetical protein